MLVLAFAMAPRAEAGDLAPPSVCKHENLKAGTENARNAMVCMTNYARRKHGLHGFRNIHLLNVSSGRKAGDIKLCGFSHEACGRPFTYWQKRAGYLDGGGCYSVGENIAWGTGGLGTVRDIFNAWLHSSDHRAAILSSSYTQIGVGSKHGKFQGYGDASIWVQQFGTHHCPR